MILGVIDRVKKKGCVWAQQSDQKRNEVFGIVVMRIFNSSYWIFGCFL